MSELTAAQQLEKELLCQETTAPAPQAVREAAAAFAEGYKQYLNAAKTEREAVLEAERMLLAAGYEAYVPGKYYIPGSKIYFIHRRKALVCATIGTKSPEAGFHITVSHIDSPRLDLKPNPLYEEGHFSLFKTHYYGGVRKYQWAALPLALHGVLYRQDGSCVALNVGEEDSDPVFCVTDLLPHLAAEQSQRTLEQGIKGEELNVLVGSEAIGDEAVKQQVKLNTMRLLHEKYGIVERDFCRAELAVVPALKACDIGFDRALVGAYGQDDSISAYPCLRAEIETVSPAFTTVCILTDKEEIGSEGVTGMKSEFAFDFMRLLCRAAGANEILAMHNSKCMCADVSSAYDPNWANAFDARNANRLGGGVSILKYTGDGGKYDTSDCSAELLSYFTRMMDAENIPWQIGEMGKVDLGGSGTVAGYMAQRGIDTIDIGVPLLCMHAPCEIACKTDIYHAYRAYKAFCGEEE